MAFATTKHRLIASTRVSALSVESWERNSWKGSIERSVSYLRLARERASARDGDGVELGRRVVLRFGVRVG